jgi:hypothetical protein
MGPPPQAGDLCYSGRSPPVAESVICQNPNPPPLYFSRQFTLLHSGIGLAEYRLQVLGGTMTRAQWLLLGAVGLGVAIVIYLVFFCPADCQ